METQNLPRWAQQLGGLGIAALGIGLTALTWSVVRQGHAVLAIGATGPAFALMGLALVCFPDYRTERVRRGESLEGREGWALLTLRWRVILVGCLLLTALFMFFLRGGL